LDEVRLFHVHAALQLLETGRLAVDESYDLSIQYQRTLGLSSKLFKRRNDLRKLTGFVLPVAGHKLHIVWRGVGKDAYAVVLRLEGPAFSGDFTSDACVHRLECSRGEPCLRSRARCLAWRTVTRSPRARFAS